MSSKLTSDNRPVYSIQEAPRQLTPEDLAFITAYTHRPADALRSNIFDVWNRAKDQTFVFMCIEKFTFLKPVIHLHPFYPKVVAAHSKAPASALCHVDAGACFGQDSRKLLLEGWTQDELIAVDAIPDYWNFGKALFMDEETLNLQFVAHSMAEEDLFDDVNLGALQGSADFVWNGQVLHCMPEKDCQKFLKNAWRLLKPGGSIYGTAAGVVEAREWTYTTDGQGIGMLYDQDKLDRALRQAGFSSIVIDSKVREELSEDKSTAQMMQFSFSASK